MKVVSIVGARPQFVKAAMVSRAIRTSGQEILIHTGQHYDENMSRIFFDELNIPRPDIQLGIGSGSHAEQTGRMMIEIEKIILEKMPDWVLVYGDTNSTLAGALAAVKLHVPVAHVEAGLRSYNRSMPEEINRVIVDAISTLLFCPTEQAVANLNKEGIFTGAHLVGDVMGDSLDHFIQRARDRSSVLQVNRLSPQGYILATVHRAGNTDEPQRLRAIIEALGQTDLTVVFPVHPRTQKSIQAYGINPKNNLKIIEPVGYLDMLQLEANADCIITDSGGVQKEAYWVGVRCITLREETEWVETVQEGWNRLVGADPAAIVDTVKHWRPSGKQRKIYGDGHAAERIGQILAHYSSN
jgi:UDP-GlcNAc3NAcA epimerase